MKIVLFSFTRRASELSRKLYSHFTSQGLSCRSYCTDKYASAPELTPLTMPLKEHVREQFHTGHALIFIGACGIAVRSIAPFIQSKTTDPCVLVIDELGQYVISLLSGHIGGGNALARHTAGFLDAVPIITTATDLNRQFSVDTFAAEHGYALSDLTLAKEISAALLDKKPVRFCIPVWEGTIPDETIPRTLTAYGLIADQWEELLASSGSIGDDKDTPIIKAGSAAAHTAMAKAAPPPGICISAFRAPKPYPRTLFLIPKQVVLGIGCRRGISPKALLSFVSEILERHRIHRQALAAVTSIDLKKEEPCLIQLAEHYAVPFITYSAEELANVPGAFTSSDFVKHVTGVDNVCERACLAYSRSEHLFLRKTASEGMTLAVSLLPAICHL